MAESPPLALRLRTHLGWSQFELARYLGTSQGTVSRLELGRPVGVQSVHRMLAFLDRDVREGRSIELPPKPESERRRRRRRGSPAAGVNAATQGAQP